MTGRIVRGRDPAAVRRILESLPDWFGDSEAIDGSVADAADEGVESHLAVVEGEVEGVALTKRHFAETAELLLIAVAPHVRGHGIGRLLVDSVTTALLEDGVECLTVHTVGPSFDHAGYAETRGFYRRLGFLPLEEHSELDWWGPTLISVRHLRRGERADDPVA